MVLGLNLPVPCPPHNPGAAKHKVEVLGSGYTVGQLQEALEELTEVPVSAQKLIFKGSCMHHILYPNL